ARLPAAPLRDHQARLGETGQLLRDCLTRDRQLGRELRRRRAPALRDGAHELAPPGVAERGEDAVYAAVHASAQARSSSAVDHSPETSRTEMRVPSGTSSSVKTTRPSSSQSRTSRSPGSTSRTTAHRSSPSSQRKRPVPPGRTSSSTSFANHSSSRSGSVSASQTSSGGAGTTTSRVTSTAPPLTLAQPIGCVSSAHQRNPVVAHYRRRRREPAHPDGHRHGRSRGARVRHLLPP